MAKISLKAVLVLVGCLVLLKGAGQCIVTASPDTVVCIAKPQVQLLASSAGTLGYTWSPATGLNNTSISNPIASPVATTSYIVTVVVPDNTELVTNGDFESGNTGFNSSYTYKANPVPGSNNLSEGQYTVKTNPSTTHQCFASCGDKTSGTGNQMIFNGSKFANVSVWSQTITVQSNTDYAFSAWLQNVTCPPYGFNAELQFSINSTLIGNVFKSDSVVCKWKQFYQIWNSGSNTSATISIVNQYTSADGNDFALDNISFKKFCKAQDTVTITIDVPTNAINRQICSGDSLFVQKQYRKIPGIYRDTLTTSTGCDSLLVTNLQVASSVSITVDTSICPADSIFLQKQYRKIAGNYYDTLTASGGCDSITTTRLQVRGLMAVTMDTSICNGDSIFLQKQFRKTAGNYYDTIIGGPQCGEIITTRLQIVNNFTNNSDTSICEGDSILRFGKYYKTEGNYFDTLASSASCKTVEITNLSVINQKTVALNYLLCGSDSLLFRGKYLKLSGVYHDTVYRGKCIDTLTILTLTAKPAPQYTFEFRLCPGDSVSYLGQFYKRDTSFYDTIVNPPFCDSILITRIRKVGVSPVLPDSSYYCEDKLAEADAGDYKSYLWSNGSTSRTLITDIEGWYWVQVTDSNNCKFTDSVIVYERCNPLFFVPTAFSPNGDGLNDIFKIEMYNILELHFIIFDRWGEVLFETDKTTFTWDGTYKGVALPVGVYHWTVACKGINKEGRILKMNENGVLNLIR